MSDPTPEMQKVRAIDVRPYRWGIWCRVGDNPKPFTNAIESRRWSDDGQTIWFMLGTHNFHNARPDEELTLVPMEELRYVDYSREEAEHAQFLAERPTHAAKCEACGGAGRVPVSTTNLRASDLPLARTERGRLQAALRDCASFVARWCATCEAAKTNRLLSAMRAITSLAGSTVIDFGGSHDEQRAAIFNACRDALAGKDVRADDYRCAAVVADASKHVRPKSA